MMPGHGRGCGCVGCSPATRARGWAALGIRRRNQTLGTPLPREAAGLKVETRLVRSRGFDPTKAPQISRPAQVAELVRKLAGSDRERFFAFYLDTQNRVIGIQQVGIGGRDYAPAPPDVVMRAAILANAAGVIIVHNHPSGVPEPSAADRQGFRDLKAAGKLLAVEVLDAVVVANGTFVSLRDRGL